MQDRLIIFDTTLRDGEQAPGIALTPDEKVAIAGQLARLKVDVIEAGFAASSPGDFESVSRIAREVKGPVIASLARTHPDDIDRAWDALREAEKARIHVFNSTSPIHMERMLKMTPEEVMQSIIEGVKRARGLLRRCGILAAGRHPIRSRVCGRRLPGSCRSRGHHHQHSRHRWICNPDRVR